MEGDNRAPAEHGRQPAPRSDGVADVAEQERGHHKTLIVNTVTRPSTTVRSPPARPPPPRRRETGGARERATRRPGPAGAANHIVAQSVPARSAAAVYRRSIGSDGQRTPQERREILLVDAARYGATSLAGPLDQPPVNLRPRRCTGSQTAPSLRTTLSGHADTVSAIGCASPNRRPIAVTGSHDRTWSIAA